MAPEQQMPEENVDCDKLPEEIDVEEVVAEVRDGLKADVAPPGNVEAELAGLDGSIQAMMGAADVVHYQLTTWRRFAAGVLALKRMVEAVVRPYARHFLKQQARFNSGAIDAVRHLGRGLDQIGEALRAIGKREDQIAELVDRHVGVLRTKLGAAVQMVTGLKSSQDRLSEAVSSVAQRVESLEQTARNTLAECEKLASGIAGMKAGSARHRNALIAEGFDYFAFENQHRGPSEVIKERQKVFLEYFQGCQQVLDVGCGRGEFLELAAENGIGARGIDVDEDMVLHCRTKGLRVEKAEVLSYLPNLLDTSLDGVVAAHVVEHMEPAEVLRFLTLAYQKLKSGAYMLVETVNPLCLNVLGTSFYLDPTHVRPVHPGLLRFMLLRVGFRDVLMDLEFPGEREPLPDGDGDEQQAALKRAVTQLQETVFGAQDYLVAALK